jgi:hypothetical protein
MRAPPILLVILLLAIAPFAGYFGLRAWLNRPAHPSSVNIPPKPDTRDPIPETRYPEPAPSRRSASFGMNLSAVVDWSREWAFVDVFKSSRPWNERGPKPFEFDPHGYPRLKADQSVETVMVREIDGHYPSGLYVCTWAGAGQLDLSKFDIKRVVDRQSQRIEIEVKPGNEGLVLAINSSSPVDPIHEIHVAMPGFEKAESPFHPLFVERLNGFGVIRFMAWQNTVNSPIHTWDERSHLDDARYTNAAGVPIEIMIDLANKLHAAPWFSMPHLADDNYVRQFARLVRDRLAPEQKAYIEYSNEVWNWGFSETRFAFDEGKRLGLGSPELFRYYAQRSLEIFRIWEEEFGGPHRLVRVLASQAVNVWGTEQMLLWKDAHKHADALAIAPYFGYTYGDPQTVDQVSRMTVDQMFTNLTVEVDGPNREVIQKQARLAKKYGLDLIAYEGGPHLAGFGGAENDRKLTELFIAANRDPRMYDLQRRHLKHWFEAGGGLYAVFAYVSAPNKWGSWGLLEYQDQPLDQAPKMRAILDLMKLASNK